MALKQLVTLKYNTFTLEVPCTKQKIKFRQFNVQEYKLFLTAKSIGDKDSLISTLNDLIEACSFGVLDTDTLEPSSIEYLFLMIRAKSYNDMIPIVYTCRTQKTIDDKQVSCNTRIYTGILLNDITVIKPEKFEESKTIYLDTDKTQGLKLKEPPAIIKKYIEDERTEDDLFGIPVNYLFDCVDFIFDDDKMLYPSSNKLDTDDSNTTEFNRQEFLDWIQEIPKDTLPAFIEFFNNLPRLGLSKPLIVKCPKCNTQEEKWVEDFESFLD